MNLSKIHHIAIIVSDYEAAKDFYVNKLGFAVIRENYRPERKDWKLDLRVNEHTELEIFAEENPPKRVNRPELSLHLIKIFFHFLSHLIHNSLVFYIYQQKQKTMAAHAAHLWSLDFAQIFIFDIT